MTLNKVYFGRFLASGQNAQWDGTNEADLLSWLNTDGKFGWEPPDPWEISAQSGSSITFNNDSSSRSVTLAVNDWVNVGGGYASPISAAGAWITSDPYGRPETLSDIEAP